VSDFEKELESSALILEKCLRGGLKSDWEVFLRGVHGVVASCVIRRLQRFDSYSKDLADDLIQETFLHLCEKNFAALRRFEGNDPKALGFYLRAIACNAVQDHFRSKRSAKRGFGKEQSLSDVTVPGERPQHSTLSPLERNILLNQIDECLKAGPRTEAAARDRQIFWMYFRHGLSSRAISELPAVQLSPKGVESALLRLTRLVREQMKSAAGSPKGKHGANPYREEGMQVGPE